ncbi:MAG TPA: hypothetical protein VFA21_12715 [Pyrinomonadaceae bacterium]|nr:hypothetical protein [Pyrinomonadaceae bacterium]
MNVETRIGVGRAPSAFASEELKRRLLALVLAAVLLWYTAVAVPTGVKPRASRPREDDERGGEVRGRAGASESERITSESTAKRSLREQVEELDWPEYICID